MNQNEIYTPLLAVAADATVPPSVRLQASQEYLSHARTVESRVVSSSNPYGTSTQRVDARSTYMQNLWSRLDESIFQQPHRAKAIAVPIDFLLNAGGVIYGSRSLHVEAEYSDYDFAFSYEEHKRVFDILVDSHIDVSNPTGYFQSSPEAGYKAFFQYKGLDPVSNEKVKVDILFVHNDEDLDVIRSSVQDLQGIPQYMLRDKKFRIDAYNKALQHRGWKLNPVAGVANDARIRGFRSARIIADEARIFGEARSAAGRGTSSWF